MKNKKIAYIFIIVFAIAMLSLAFYFFVGRDMIAERFIYNGKKTDNLSQAITMYNKALKLQPENATARNDVVDLYIQMGEFEKAHENIKEGIKINPENDDLYLYKVKLYEAEGKIQKAIDTVESITSNYTKSKFSNKIEVRFSLPDGDYEEVINVELTSQPSTNIYYKVNTEEYKKYKEPIELGDGFHSIFAVAIDEKGLVSNVFKSQYEVQNMSAPVFFGSDNIKMKMEEQVGIFDEIQRKDLQIIETLDFSYMELFDEDIEAISNCINLKEIKLGDISNVTSLKPLKNLQSLEKIFIVKGCTNDAFCDILEIDKIREIRILNSPIYKIPKNQSLVKNLTLKNCLISDIHNISTYKTLEELDLSYNVIEEIDGVQELKILNTLNLSNNKIMDIQFLKDVISIKDIDLSYNKIRETDALSSLKFVEELNISNNEIASVLNFSMLRYIKKLDCSFNNILTLEPMVNNTSIQEIHANDNYITDISYISQIKSLNYIKY